MSPTDPYTLARTTRATPAAAVAMQALARDIAEHEGRDSEAVAR